MNDFFHITYRLFLQDGDKLEERIRSLQLEQSAELPGNVVASIGMQHVTGEVIRQEAADVDGAFDVTIAWPQQNHGNEITQFLNVLFGNISLKQGIMITGIRWSDVSPALFRGPSFGIPRIRELWGIPVRPLSCTALKPVGYSSEQLAGLAFELAVGGMDIIKDDHGLADQPSAPFIERVKHCVAAMDRAADKTGIRSRYFPNITADFSLVKDRYEMACEMGADGVLLSPMLAGPSVMHHLAHLSANGGIPIMAHPAFSGRYIADGSGMRCGFEAGLFYGGLFRALGADFVIYPNYGGRFSYSQETCHDINRQARGTETPFPAAFPTPGGGMQLDRMSHWIRTYGNDTTFLIGGSLYEDSRGLEAAARAFANILAEKA